MSEQGRDWKEAQEELPGNVLFLTYEMVTWVCSLCEIIPSCKYMIYVLLYMCLDKKTSKTKQKKSTMPKRIVNITAFLLYLFPFNLSLLSLDRILSMFFIKEFVYIMPPPRDCDLPEDKNHICVISYYSVHIRSESRTEF